MTQRRIGVTVSNGIITVDLIASPTIFTRANGNGLPNALVVLTDQSGTTRTGTFRYFRFGEIASGQTVILTVKSKLYQFAPHVVTVTDSISDLELSPLAQ